MHFVSYFSFNVNFGEGTLDRWHGTDINMRRDLNDKQNKKLLLHVKKLNDLHVVL